MRSDKISASSMLWVTKITVLRSLGDDVDELVLKELARHRVDRGERFVHQQNLGVVCK